MKNIGETLTIYRKKAKLSQIDVAERLTKAGFPLQK